MPSDMFDWVHLPIPPALFAQLLVGLINGADLQGQDHRSCTTDPPI
jgi:predicted ABC-type sugar transport system permease subunit